MRVGLDATPLLGQLTGIGVYTRRLLDGLARLDPQLGPPPRLSATAFTLRGAGRLPALLPPGVAHRSRPVPARVLRAAWARTELPPVEWLCGPVDVFHGTNFVLPPTRRAAGVVTVHDLSFLRYPETVSSDSLRYRELVPRSIGRAARVCALTHAMADEISAEYRIDRDRITVTAPGVDESWFAATPLSATDRSRLGLPERYLIAVGTLEPRKNLRNLVQAYRRLLGEEPATPPLVLVGARGWGPELDLASLPAGSVITPGYLDDDTLRQVVAGAACLAYPSLYEGFGLPPVEALACGVPVVAADLPVTREVLGDAAVLVDATDPDALAGALGTALAAESALSAESGGTPSAAVASRRAQAARWTWQGCAEAAWRAYADALADC